MGQTKNKSEYMKYKERIEKATSVSEIRKIGKHLSERLVTENYSKKLERLVDKLVMKSRELKKKSGGTIDEKKENKYQNNKSRKTFKQKQIFFEDLYGKKNREKKEKNKLSKLLTSSSGQSKSTTSTTSSTKLPTSTTTPSVPSPPGQSSSNQCPSNYPDSYLCLLARNLVVLEKLKELHNNKLESNKKLVDLYALYARNILKKIKSIHDQDNTFIDIPFFNDVISYNVLYLEKLKGFMDKVIPKIPGLDTAKGPVYNTTKKLDSIIDAYKTGKITNDVAGQALIRGYYNDVNQLRIELAEEIEDYAIGKKYADKGTLNFRTFISLASELAIFLGEQFTKREKPPEINLDELPTGYETYWSFARNVSYLMNKNEKTVSVAQTTTTAPTPTKTPIPSTRISVIPIGSPPGPPPVPSGPKKQIGSSTINLSDNIIKDIKYTPINIGDNLDYVQKQQGLGCGRHALNNLFREEIFIKGDLNEAFDFKILRSNDNKINLSLVCKLTEFLQKKMAVQVNKNYCNENENYDIIVLQTALIIAGYDPYDYNPNTNNLNDENNTIGFIVNKGAYTYEGKTVPNGRHWVALYKNTDNTYIEYDSIGPKTTFYNTFDEYKKTGNYSYIQVLNSNSTKTPFDIIKFFPTCNDSNNRLKYNKNLDQKSAKSIWIIGNFDNTTNKTFTDIRNKFIKNTSSTYDPHITFLEIKPEKNYLNDIINLINLFPYCSNINFFNEFKFKKFDILSDTKNFNDKPYVAMYDNKDAIFKFNTSFIKYLTDMFKLKKPDDNKNNLYEYKDTTDNLVFSIPDYYVDEKKINPHVTIFKMNELKNNKKEYNNDIKNLIYNNNNDKKKNKLIKIFNKNYLKDTNLKDTTIQIDNYTVADSNKPPIYGKITINKNIESKTTGGKRKKQQPPVKKYTIAQLNKISKNIDKIRSKNQALDVAKGLATYGRQLEASGAKMTPKYSAKLSELLHEISDKIIELEIKSRKSKKRKLK